jgi:uncharacterized phage-associated protein
MENREAFASANYIIEKLGKYKIRDVTNLKLQKLLYFAYGVHLSLYNEKLFTAPIQAWQLGPVIPCVYQEFKDYGKNPISLQARAVILKDDFSGEAEIPEMDEWSRENQVKSLSIACAAYGQKKAWDLVDITHGEKSAWKKSYNEKKRGVNIPDTDIKAEFENYMDTLAQYLLG